MWSIFIIIEEHQLHWCDPHISGSNQHSVSVTTTVTAISDTYQCTLDMFVIPVLCVHQLPSLKYSQEFLFDYQVKECLSNFCMKTSFLILKYMRRISLKERLAIKYTYKKDKYHIKTQTVTT